jgi:maleate isomerase
MALQTASTDWQAEWQTLPCEFDDALAGRAAIGLLALASDGVIESELRKFLPQEGVAVFTTRLPRIPDTTPSSLKLMEQGIAECTGRLLPGRKLNALAFGCTSAAMVIGPASVTAKIHAVREGVAVTDPVSASLKALALLGTRRVAVLTPYVDSVNAEVASYLTRNGLTIVDCASFKQVSGTINRITESDVYHAGVHLARGDAEAVFVSCTGLRCSSVIEQLEREINKPVVASNQALAWDLLRLAGIKDQVPGFGRLLTT